MGTRNTLLRSIAALLAAVLLVAGCSLDGDTGERPQAAPPAPLAAYYEQKPKWTDCRNGFECAKVTVPLDYAEPEGETIQLSVIRLRASRNDRIGSIVLNPGGPGGSGIQYARAARSVLTGKVRARFDVVGFDPRGVGESAPIRCMSAKELDEFITLDASPDSPQEVSELERASREFAEACEAKSGRLLPHVGTADAARDMDVLRAVLGDTGLTYLGKSYGTSLGAAYAEQFPQNVRALVLDGAVDPSLPPLELNQTQAQGFEVAFRAFLEDCFKDAACPFQSREVGPALDELSALLRRADEKPLRNTLRDGREVTESWVMLGVVTPLYDRRSWPVLRQALGQAFNGDGTTLLRLADLLIDRREDGTYSNQTEANMAINCVDSVYPRSATAYEKAAEQADKEAPRFGSAVMWGSLPCAYWPVQPTEQPPEPRAEGAAPILVVGTQRDPATPYEWSEALARQLSSGVLLGFDGDGHTAYLTGSNCVDQVVDDYLINLKVPENGMQCPKI
jgi:pimeloyl-ACP methyl ester carboxylesterase